MLEYAKNLFQDFCELHGDRQFGDDKAMVGGFALLDGDPVVVIGQKKDPIPRSGNFTTLEWLSLRDRKALRLMKLAEKFNRPIITLIDTPGAYPGIEQRNVGRQNPLLKIFKKCSN